MVILDALPAGFGDCLWIEYGRPSWPSTILVDGGLGSTADVIRERVSRAMRERSSRKIRFRLFVITHIDKDHINGALEFLDVPRVPVEFDEIWFNGGEQLAKEKYGRGDRLGYKEGERLSDLLGEQFREQWNKWTDGSSIAVPDDPEPLPQYALDSSGDARIWLFGPSRDRLKNLSDKWEEAMGEFAESYEDEQGEPRRDLLGKGETWPPKEVQYGDPDEAVPNGSSIAFMLEVEGKRLFLTGDAFAEDLLDSLDRYAKRLGLPADARVPVDLFKLSHHGSERNLSPELVQRLKCNRFLFSTNCRQHRHPNYSTVLRILRYSDGDATLQFNYEADKTVCWRDYPVVIDGKVRDYRTEYPLSEGLGHRNRWP